MRSLDPLVGEHLALDLRNTRVNLPTNEPVDLLETVAALRHWVECESGRLPSALTTGRAAWTREDLDAVRSVREQAASAIEHARVGAEPPRGALLSLNDAQRAAPMIRELSWNGDAVSASEQRDGPAGIRLAAYLAEATAQLLTDPKVTTIKQCEADFCALLFLPANPRRRWCSTKVCGNRARVARHYRRARVPASSTADGS